MSAAESQFQYICERPAMFGAPAEVETALWVCMSIWAKENLKTKDTNPVHTAVGIVRKTIPVLKDRAGLSFRDLCKEREYGPVIENMKRAFALLKSQAESSEAERVTRSYVDYLGKQDPNTAKRLRQLFCQSMCPTCWTKRPDIIAASNGAWCACHPQPVK